MIINNVIFSQSLDEVLTELQSQLTINQIPLLQITKDSVEDIMIQCPYHKSGQERKPSAGIRKSDGKFHCFTCGETHELQEVISHCFGHYEDVLGGFGWKWLNKNFKTISVEERKGIQIDVSRTFNNISNSSNSNYVTEEELKSYRYYHPYMFKRKLNECVIELFDIGYDKKTDCITFPIRDIKGNCLFIARRSVKTKYFNYPKGVEKPLYGLYELERVKKPWKIVTTDGEEHIGYNYPKEIIVCESMIDALTCWVYGKYAVALNGLGNERQFEELIQLPCRKLILATDNDDAGMRARDRIRKNVKNKIITEYIWDKEMAKDINDMTKEQFENLEEIF